jgi:hypothetical protein
MRFRDRHETCPLEIVQRAHRSGVEVVLRRLRVPPHVHRNLGVGRHARDDEGAQDLLGLRRGQRLFFLAGRHREQRQREGYSLTDPTAHAIPPELRRDTTP